MYSVMCKQGKLKDQERKLHLKLSINDLMRILRCKK
jgi:hypothetical protein